MAAPSVANRHLRSPVPAMDKLGLRAVDDPTNRRHWYCDAGGLRPGESFPQPPRHIHEEAIEELSG
jgi:hypothetical protein